LQNKQSIKDPNGLLDLFIKGLHFILQFRVLCVIVNGYWSNRGTYCPGAILLENVIA